MNYEDDPPWPGSITTGLRLLPWRDPSGKRCYLSTSGGAISRLADAAEAAQTATAEQILASAREVLDDSHADTSSLRFALRHTCEALDHLLVVAESRGARLIPAGMEGEESPDEDALPTLPATSL
nr:hypothetical protein OG999_26725 [Streptomyces sp. NBC_00886]